MHLRKSVRSETPSDDGETNSDQGSVMALLIKELMAINNARAERKKNAQSMARFMQLMIFFYMRL